MNLRPLDPQPERRVGRGRATPTGFPKDMQPEVLPSTLHSYPLVALGSTQSGYGCGYRSGYGLLLAVASACPMSRNCGEIFKRVFRIQVFKSSPSSFKLHPPSILPCQKTRLLALDFQVCNAACQHAQIRTREIDDGLIELPNNQKPSLITPFIKPRFPKHSGRLEAAVCSF